MATGVEPDVSISAAAVDGGGPAPTPSDESSPEDNFSGGQENLARIIASKGAGSQEAKDAQAALDAEVQAAFDALR